MFRGIVWINEHGINHSCTSIDIVDMPSLWSCLPSFTAARLCQIITPKGLFVPLKKNYLLVGNEFSNPASHKCTEVERMGLQNGIFPVNDTHTLQFLKLNVKKQGMKINETLCTERIASHLIQKGKEAPWGWLFDKPTANEIHSQIRNKPSHPPPPHPRQGSNRRRKL